MELEGVGEEDQHDDPGLTECDEAGVGVHPTLLVRNSADGREGYVLDDVGTDFLSEREESNDTEDEIWGRQGDVRG